MSRRVRDRVDLDGRLEGHGSVVMCAVSIVERLRPATVLPGGSDATRKNAIVALVMGVDRKGEWRSSSPSIRSGRRSCRCCPASQPDRIVHGAADRRLALRVLGDALGFGVAAVLNPEAPPDVPLDWSHVRGVVAPTSVGDPSGSTVSSSPRQGVHDLVRWLGHFAAAVTDKRSPG